jgi:hypothetical protein
MSTLPTKLMEQCEGNNYPFHATNLEPLKWNSKVEYWTDEATPRLSYVEYFMNDILQFRHLYEYDDINHTVTITVE